MWGKRFMVNMDELRKGTRPQISERELAELRGCSTSTLQKERVTGRGPEFLKDPVTGRISYEAAAVIKFFDRAIHCHSTSEYDTRSQQERLAKARTALKDGKQRKQQQVHATEIANQKEVA